MQNYRYFAALELFNHGHYFEAHEGWEDVWRVAEEPERRFLQGLIQAAVAMHHYESGNLEGAISLAGKALRRLEGHPESFAGIQLGAFRTELATWLTAVEAGVSPAVVRIHRLADGHSKRTNF